MIYCVFCGSFDVIKRGFRRYRGRRKQRYGCENCHKRFVFWRTGKKIRGKIGSLVLSLRKEGLTLRSIREKLALLGVKVHYETIRQHILQNNYRKGYIVGKK